MFEGVPERVRHELAEQLNVPLDELPLHLLDDAWDRVKYDRTGIDFLVKALPEAHRRAPRMVTKRKAPGISGATVALSQLVARIGNQDPSIQAFRREVLPGGLVPWSDIEEWVNHQRETAGPPTTYLTIPLPEGTRMVRHESSRRFVPPLDTVGGISIKRELLCYFAPTDTTVRLVPTTFGSSLERLRRLAKEIARSYAWDEASSTVFVLTAVAPLVEPVRVTIRGEVIRDDRPHRWARRVLLDIDPATSPEIVKAAYSEARRALGTAGTRKLSDKHAALAVFCAEHEGWTWLRRLREWNRQHSKWRYSQDSNFRRDASSGQRHLLDPTATKTSPRRAKPKSEARDEVEVFFEDEPPAGTSPEELSEILRNVIHAYNTRQGMAHT